VTTNNINKNGIIHEKQYGSEKPDKTISVEPI
jgi:hypothetical protein